MSARPSSRRAIGLVGLAVAATGLVAIPLTASANPAGTGLVISEVYGGGGNSGATLHQRLHRALQPDRRGDLRGRHGRCSTAPARGTSAQVTPLTGQVPPGGHYLVQEAAGAGGTPALPTPDATGIDRHGGTARGRPPRPHHGPLHDRRATSPETTDLLDAVGYGTTATSFEETNTGVNLTNTTAAARSTRRCRHRQERS